MSDSNQLLDLYRNTASESAFAELVARYVNLVYSTALRLVDEDTHLAEDVVQTVFIDFARLASTLEKGVMIGGWLHRHTCYVAANTMRTERRRRAREQASMEIAEVRKNSDYDVSGITPLLDAAINQLNDNDRTAIVLRFFEESDFRSIAVTLGSNEDAARMRVNRALEKLEQILRKQGVVAPSTALTAILLQGTAQAAPVGLAASVAAAATTSFVQSGTSSVVFAKTITMTTLQKTLIAATLATAIGTAVYQSVNASRARDQLSALEQNQAALQERLNQAERDRDAAAQRFQQLADSIDDMKDNSSEILKLRGEVSRLRRAADQLSEIQQGTNSTDPIIAEAAQWRERVNLLRNHLEGNPNAAIPELALLTEQDWLNAARDPLKNPLDYRQAMSKLRSGAENKMAQKLSDALKGFLKKHDEKSLTDVSQLLPYFDPPIDPALLQRYAILPKDAVPTLGMGGDWIISQTSPIDPQLDGRSGIGPHGWGSSGPSSWKPDPAAKAGQTLEPVFNAYLKANQGRQPQDPAELLPYIKTAEQKAAYELLLELRKADQAGR